MMYRVLSLTSDKHVPISEAVVEVKNTNTSNAQQGEHMMSSKGLQALPWHVH